MNCTYLKCVCVSLLLFTGVLAQAQAPKATLHGRVTDPSSSSVPNALVVVKAPGSAQLKRTTDLQGQYSFANIPAAKYTITVTRQGFSPAQMEDYAIKRRRHARLPAECRGRSREDHGSRTRSASR